jgi:hypothetical protein
MSRPKFEPIAPSEYKSSILPLLFLLQVFIIIILTTGVQMFLHKMCQI